MPAFSPKKKKNHKACQREREGREREKKRGGKGERRNKTEQTKQSAGPNSDVIQMLELTDRNFQITVVNVARALVEKVDNM